MDHQTILLDNGEEKVYCNPINTFKNERNSTNNQAIVFLGKKIPALFKKVRNESTTKTFLKQTKFTLTTKGMKIPTMAPAISAVKNNSNNNTHFLCPIFMGGFGNMMFQLAAHFGAAMSKGMREAKSKIDQTVKRFNIGSTRDVTLVGVHVRRGDMVNHKFGYNIATPEYLTKAVQYFKSKYKNVIFIISSQDIPWTKANMPNNTNVEYLTSPKREIIVATLTLCNHTITTVGSFSWWIGWLTGGEVTYFKWPAKEGSRLRKQYSKDFSDFFYPGWIGM
ncbi:FUT1_2 [Mytilus coruscus]|uniref:L-Fucosyltransferase n=1 Tax=Mytilus coruscus TaxID=42192 RepID=A0A6J8F248_MYTCO|nr:FUT1_2 [Mytilus coruscus]